jgi:hypothetical protein
MPFSPCLLMLISRHSMPLPPLIIFRYFIDAITPLAIITPLFRHYSRHFADKHFIIFAMFSFSFHYFLFFLSLIFDYLPCRYFIIYAAMLAAIFFRHADYFIDAAIDYCFRHY